MSVYLTLGPYSAVLWGYFWCVYSRLTPQAELGTKPGPHAAHRIIMKLRSFVLPEVATSRFAGQYAENCGMVVVW